jgi:hypothetical protein
MSRHILPLLLASLAANPLAVVASEKGSTFPIGSAFSYQGELRSAGQPASGLHDFEACLFDAAGPGGDPAIACSIIEDQPLDAAGRFTLELDFGAQFNGTVRFVEMRVRPGASGGAFTPLLPRQAIRPTPEALRAARSPWSGLLGVPSGFADNLDNVGVTSVVPGSGLTTLTSGSGAGAPIVTTGTLSVRPGGIDASMIAPGAIGTAQIDPTQVQARLAASCAEGDYLAGIASDGTPDCASIPARFDRVIESSNDVGSDLDLALRADDRPVVAYYSATLGNLKLYSCSNRACTSGVARTPDSAGDVGRGPALALRSDGRPVIAYQDFTNLALKLYVCADVECSSGTRVTLDESVDVMARIALVIRGDGRPLIGYGESTGSNARVFDCVDAACSSGTSRVVAGSMGSSSSLSIVLDAAGLPVIAKGGFGGAGTPIFLIRCSDPGCVSTAISTFPNEYGGLVDMVVRNTDRPLIAATSLGSPTVDIYDCTTPACSARNEYNISTELSDRVALELDGITPVIAFQRFVTASERHLRFHRCAAPTCSEGASRTLYAGPDESVGMKVALKVRSDGRPVIAHYDLANQDLLLHICANPDCL